MSKPWLRASLLAWIKEYAIVNEQGRPIDVSLDSNHFFLNALYRDRSKNIVVRKPSQAGVSLYLILRALWRAIEWGINQIHTLPTASDVKEFVPNKTNMVIKNNPYILGKTDHKQVDSVEQKQFGRGFLFYKGTKTEREAQAITSDANYYDELDRSNTKEIVNYGSRQEGAFSLGEQVWISTPTMAGSGIDQRYEESDQKHWRFTCGHCGTRQHMQWPENVDMDKKKYVCQRCRKPIDPKWIRPKTTRNPIGTGAWEARFPARNISGYWLTQMIFPWISPAKLVDYYKDAEKGKPDHTLQYFYNHKMGLPFTSPENEIPPALIFKNLRPGKEHTELKSCMGVDVQGSELYVLVGNKYGIYVIGSLKDDDEFKKTEGKKGVSKWDRLADYMNGYDVQVCVIDGGYTPNEALAFAARYPYRVYVNWYQEDQKSPKVSRFNDEDFHGKQMEVEEAVRILTDRNRAIDHTLAVLREGTVIHFIYTQQDPAIETLVKHVKTTSARIVIDNKGVQKREWFSTGQDDLLHALIYWLIAFEKSERK